MVSETAKITMFLAVAAGGSLVLGYGAYKFYQSKKKQQKEKDAMDAMMKILEKSSVYVRDLVGLRSKLRKMYQDGADNLQIISDFDRTITKYVVNGEKADTTIGVIENSKQFPESYRQKTKELKDHYLPLEFDVNVSAEQKTASMLQWWNEALELITELGIKREQLEVLVKEANIGLRDGVEWFFVKMHEKNIPVLVYSAGITDIIKEVIDQQSALYSNITIEGNVMKFNSEGVMDGFKGKMIYSNNKKQQSSGLSFFEVHKDCANVLVMGDIPEDSEIACNVKKPETVLSIGFLNFKVDERLAAYKDAFDIVIVDDHSMEVVDLLLMEILQTR